MKKIPLLFLFLSTFLLNIPIGQTNTQVPASNVSTTTGTWNKCLGSGNTTVQSALNSLDQCSGTNSPGGVNPQYQYNNGGSFAGGNMYQGMNGNVGIGTPTPKDQLSIYTTTAQPNGLTSYNTAGLPIIQVRGNQSTNDYTGAVTISGNGMESSSGYGATLAIHSPNEASFNVSIYNDFNSSTIPQFSYFSADTDDNTYPLKTFVQNTYDAPMMLTTDAGLLRPDLFIATGGNIGLGSFSPGQKLDVQGTARFSLNAFVGNQPLCQQNGTNCPGGETGFANPTGTIGLTPVNGVLTTAPRSDSAPALSQAIVPTWTGLHTFNASPISIITGGNVGIGTPSPAVSLANNGDFTTKGPVADVRAFEGGTISNTDNLAAINACFSSSANTCYLSPGTWKISGTVVVPGSTSYSGMGKKLLLDQGAILQVTGDFSPIQLMDKSQEYGGILSAVGILPFTSPMIYVQGRTNGIEPGTGAENVSLYENNNDVVGNGDGIYLQADAANQYIAFSGFRNIKMFGVNKAIHLSASSAGGGNFVNGNIFEHIVIVNPVFALYCDGDGTNSNECEGNQFTDIQVQTSPQTDTVIFSNSNYNTFSVFPFDITGTTKSVNFTSTSNGNFVYMYPSLLGGGSGFIDSGTGNNFIGKKYTGNNQIYGNLGINNDASSYTLDVRAPRATANFQSTTGTNSVPINFINTGNPSGNSATIGIESSVGGSLFTGSTAYSLIFGTSTTNPIQFATNNSIRMTISGGANNIGIGSTVPRGNLDVGPSGTIYGQNLTGFTGTAQIATIRPTGSTVTLGGSGETVAIGATNGEDFGGFAAKNIGSLSVGSSIAPNGGVAYFNGNLGIGSTTPGQALDVTGTIRASSNILIGAQSVCQANGTNCPGGITGLANPTATIGLSANNGSATTAMRSDASPALGVSISPTWTGNHIFSPSSGSTVFTSGNVGINSTAPGQILDIQGILRTTGFNITSGAGNGKLLTSDSSGNGTWASPATSGTVTSIATSNGITGGTITTSGTISGINAASDGSTKGVAAFNATDFSCSSGVCDTIQGIATTSSPTFTNETVNTNLGIGVAPNSFTLDVRAARGTVNIQSTTGTNSVPLNFTNTGNPAGNTATIGIESSTGGSLFTGSTAYGLIFGTSTTNPIQFATNNAINMTIASGGNIGMGSTNPGSILDVVGTARIKGTNGQPYLQFLGGGGAGTTPQSWGFNNSGANFAGLSYFGSNGNRMATFWDNRSVSIGTTYATNVQGPTDGAIIQGNVGIGSSTPRGSLDTGPSGTIYGQNLTGFSGTAQIATIRPTGSTITLGGSGEGVLISGTNGVDFGNNVAKNISTLSVASSTAPTGGVAYFNGNVGIGSTTAGSLLDVTTSTAGTIARMIDTGAYGGLKFRTNGADKLLIGDAGYATATGSAADAGIGSFANLLFGTGASQTVNMELTSGGNLGIGSTAPGQALDIVGTVRITGSLNTGAAQTTVNCSTSGTVIFSEPLQGISMKKVVIFANACLGTASYTYPVAFTNTPAVNYYAGTSGVATSVSTSAVTITGTTLTENISLEGY